MTLAVIKSRIAFLFYGMAARFISVKSIQVKRGVLKMHIGTSNEFHRAVTFFGKEPETLAWIDGFLDSFPSGDLVFFDVGANVGVYSLYAGVQLPRARIYSFEPDAQSFASLCRNIKLNRLEALPYPMAVSDDVGIGSLMSSSMDAGAGASALGEQYKFMKAQSEDVFKQGIFHCSLDELVSRFGLPTPNFLKIDVDGIEQKILFGARNVLKNPGFKGLLVELQYRSEPDLKDVLEYLRSCGLSLNRRSDWVALSFNGLNSRNFIFSRAP